MTRDSHLNAGYFGTLSRAAILAVIAMVTAWYLTPTAASAQLTPVGVGLTSDKESVTVGDVFTLTLTVNHPSDHQVILPDVPSQWDEFDVRRTTPLSTVSDSEGNLTSVMEIEAALFRPGVHSTPALSVAIRRPDGSVINRPARPIELEVMSVLSEGANELKDIRPQAGVPFPEVWPWAVGGAATLVALTLVAGFYWRRKTMPQTLLITQEIQTPLELALATLDRIERMDLASESQHLEHYTLVADCLRAYLFGQFRIPAPELTTEQSIAVLDRRPVPPADVRDLGGLLEEADLVKFARLVPEGDEVHQSVATARRVVTELTAAPSRFRPASGYTSGRYTR